MIVYVQTVQLQYEVELPDGLTVDDLPRLIEANKGIVVPIKNTEEINKMFIPASQIIGIGWLDAGIIVEEEDDLADVTYIETSAAAADLLGDIEVMPPKTGPNGEVFIDS